MRNGIPKPVLSLMTLSTISSPETEPAVSIPIPLKEIVFPETTPPSVLIPWDEFPKIVQPVTLIFD